jgi:phosphomannomutase
LSKVIESISGLRGIYPSAINAEYAFSAACKFSGFIGKGKIAVGMDTRQSSFTLSRAAAAGIMYAGCQAVWLGVVTTPELFHYVRTSSIEGGIMITASHNPREWNGLKLIKGGRGIFEEELRQVLSNSCKSSKIACEENGDSSKYYEDVERMLGDKLHGLRIGLDLAGGSACIHVPSTFKRSGADVYAVNASPGIFTRVIDPTQDNLDELSKIMKIAKCDVGLAFDCDGDRLQVVDAYAGKLPPDYTLYLAVKHAESIDKIVVSVDTSDVVVEEARKRGMQVFISPVGEANVLRMMMEKGCLMGGEGSSAGVIDSRFSYCRDGLLASTYVIKEIAERGRIDIDEFRGHAIIRKKVNIDKDSSEKLLKRLEEDYPDASKVDGMKIRFDDGWCLIRRSRTENALRISVEGVSREKAEEILNMVNSKISGLAGEE